MKLLGAFSEDLKHLKRVRPQGEQLAVLLAEEVSEELRSFLLEQNVSPVTVQVPRHCPFTSEQLESFQRHWPVKKLVSSFQPLELTQDSQRRVTILLRKHIHWHPFAAKFISIHFISMLFMAFQELRDQFASLLRQAEDAGGCALMEPNGHVVTAGAGEGLQHPAMVAIEAVAEEARKRFASQKRCLERESEEYLCQDCDVVLTKEPCIMCAMALVHSRVRRIAFRDSDGAFGGFGGRIALHHCKSLNHHPRILQWKKEPIAITFNSYIYFLS